MHLGIIVCDTLGPRLPHNRKRNVAQKWIERKRRVHQLYCKYSTCVPDCRTPVGHLSYLSPN